MKKILILIILAGIGASVGSWYLHGSGRPDSAFRTVAVKRGELLATISATGTVEPEEVVDIGAQVAGQVARLGVDPRDSSKSVDYGTPVDEGTVLARIDDTLYKSDVDVAVAQAAQAKANVRRAEADLVQMKAKVGQARNDWERARTLTQTKAMAPSDYDMYEANYGTTNATVAVGEAAIDQAKAALVQADASLLKAKQNLGYCTIRSPVKGVIVDRRVNVGQTVVASLNAPSLFLIAKDLKRLQVWASVNEADIGQIKAGQPVSFTVDAHAGEVFRGAVSQIRLNATMTQNVVTYTVVVSADNSTGKLLPYMTANLQFEVNKRQDVLLVPNAALRWWPLVQQVVPEARGDLARLSRRSDKAGEEQPREATNRGVVWMSEDGLVRPIKVRLGLSDGTMTEVEGKFPDDAAIVIGEERASAGNDTTNPFAPQMFKGKAQ